MRGERAGHTLQTTALVHEAFLRLIDWKNVRWQNRAHFFGMSAKLMRRILVDCARTRTAAKRGGDAQRILVSEAGMISRSRPPDIVALDEALTILAQIDSRQSQIVELRFFGGLSVRESAEMLQISTRTLLREWSLAQAWLHARLCKEEVHEA